MIQGPAYGDVDHAQLEEPLGSLPFIVVTSGSTVVVTLASDAGLHPTIAETVSWSWASEISGRVIVDASRLRLMNSPLCSWMVNLMRCCGPRRLVVMSANARVRETLHLLKLDALITVVA